jgi:hypothetical protein
VAHVLSKDSLNIDFRHTLTGDKCNFWLHLAQQLVMVHHFDEPGTIQIEVA